MTAALSLPWPIVVVDVEASSLELDGYPIEVGLAIWSAADQPVLGWSALIRPTPAWTREGHWSSGSAAVHGIPRDELVAHGREPASVAAALNEVVGAGALAWCDGGVHDARWLGALFRAGGISPAFGLGDWDRLLGQLDRTGCARAWMWLERTPQRHRARADAERLVDALIHGIGLTDRTGGELVDLKPGLA